MELSHLTNETLLIDTKILVTKEKSYSLQILHHLFEIEQRKLYAILNYSSLYAYCVNELYYSEQESLLRINSMRTLKKIKCAEEKVKDGSISLTQLGQLGGYLSKVSHDESKNTPEKKEELIKKIEGKTIRETKEILQKELGEKPSETVQLKISKELYLKLQNLKNKLNQFSEEELLLLLCNEKEKELENKKAVRENKNKNENKSENEKIEIKNPQNRYISRKMKDKLLGRADYQCQYISPITGKRCAETNRLEINHKIPFGAGGLTIEENLNVLCRTHNVWEGVVYYGAHKFNSF